MRNVTIEEAIKKGRIQLYWIPIILIVLFLCLSTAVSIYLPGENLILSGVFFLCAFVVPICWWSYNVVHWKIWAFTSVKDGKTLEKRAISRQVIIERGSWFEKMEFKNKTQKETLGKLYEKIDSVKVKKEMIIDHTLPPEMTVNYPKINIYIGLVFILASIGLIYIEKYFFGILGLVLFPYFTFDAYKKVKSKEFAFKLSSKGITLPNFYYAWEDIEEYFIKRTGYSEHMQFFLVLKGVNFLREVPLVDLNISAFKIERFVDVYWSRYQAKNKYLIKKESGDFLF